MGFQIRRTLGSMPSLMFKTGTVGALVLALVLQNAAQNAAKPQEPEYANSFFYLDATGALKPLERASVAVAAKIHALGFGGGSASYEIQGERSSVRFAAGSPIAVIVKLENHDVDPATQVILYSLQSGQGKRQLLITRTYYAGLGRKSDLQKKQLQMVFTKYGQSSVKIEPANPLLPGEYALAMQTQSVQPLAYCFGVGAAQ
jgi:hypothetical protein